MITSTCQRWRDKRGSYRPAGEVIVTRDYEVAPIADDRTAKAFVQKHHYSRKYLAARRRYGLYRRGGELAGVVILSQPVNNAIFRGVPGTGLERAELGRIVLLDDVPGNGETWTLARVFDLARRNGLVALVSHSDPVPRTTVAGDTVFAGHVGTIYQASNASYRGLTRQETRRLLPDGTVFHNRAAAKIRKRERGWRPAARELESFGATPLRDDEDARAWLKRWLPSLTRPLVHGGNHRYWFGLTKAARRHLPTSLDYPKFSPNL